MAKRDHAQEGTRDYCVHCNGVVILRRDPKRYSHYFWEHLDPQDPEKPVRCGEVDKPFKFNSANPKNFCSVRVETSWHYNLCNRPAKDLELHMCGIHANHERKRLKKEKDWREKYELNLFIREQVGELVKQLEEEWGISAKIHYEGTYTGKVVVDPEELLKLLDDLGNMEEV